VSNLIDGTFGMNIDKVIDPWIAQRCLAMNRRLDFLAHCAYPRLTATEAEHERIENFKRPLRPGRFRRTPNAAARRSG
jgi:hypothetical protein